MQDSARVAPCGGRRIHFCVVFALLFISIFVLSTSGWSTSAIGEVSGGLAASAKVYSSTLLSIYPLSSSGVVGTVHTVTATVIVNQSKAYAGIESITFEVLTGPNADVEGVLPVGESGHAVFSYTGTGGPGIDQIRAYCDPVSSCRSYSSVVTMEWTSPEGDCNQNGINDSDEISQGLAEDCNNNGIPDECDIRDGTSLDCNLDGVPDECGVCPPVDLIFLMDTSGSMDDESAALCANIATAASDLAELGISVNPKFLGITDQYFPCLEDYVTNLLGTAVPGSSSCGTDITSMEDWGPAVAVVAQRYPWTAGNVRLIVPISDEGPCHGNTCYDPGDDRDAITNAITIAVNNNCFVSPITGTGANDCTIALAQDLAAGTRGTTFVSTNPADEFAQAIFNVVKQACEQTIDCNANGIPDECDISSGVSLDANQNGVPDECETQSEFIVLDKFGAVFDVGNTTPFLDLAIEPIQSVAVAATNDCKGLVVLDKQGLLHPYGTASMTLAGRDYGCQIARDVEVTPSGDGAYVLSGFGTVEVFGAAPHYGSAFFGSFTHPFDAARDLDLLYGILEKASGTPGGGEVSGYYILNCLGQVKTFGAAEHFGEAVFGYDIARAIEVAPDGAGYLILDGFGQVHGFGTMETVANNLATQNPFFALDIARDLEITPAGAGWYILDGHGNVFSVGDAGTVVNDPLVSTEDVFTDLELCGGSPVVGAGKQDAGQVALILKVGNAETTAVREEPPTYAEDASSCEADVESPAIMATESSALSTSVTDNVSESSQMTVKFEGKSSLIPKEDASQVTALVVALVQSCQGTASEATVAEWRKARTAESSLYLRFKTPVKVEGVPGKTLTLNALVVPMDSESAGRKVLLLSDPKGIGEYTTYEGYDTASLKNLLDAVRK